MIMEKLLKQVVQGGGAYCLASVDNLQLLKNLITGQRYLICFGFPCPGRRSNLSSKGADMIGNRDCPGAIERDLETRWEVDRRGFYQMALNFCWLYVRPSGPPSQSGSSRGRRSRPPPLIHVQEPSRALDVG